ncbi:hypothetical protein N9H93_00370 [Rhizobiaceae bacterium]|nr:hypothetical protein [Rhizobiaceae bacterium]
MNGVVLAAGISLLCLTETSALAHDVMTLDGFSDDGKPSWAEFERPMDVIAERLKAFPESAEGRPTLKVETRVDDKNNLVVDYFEDGLADDSVSAIHTRFVVHEAYPGSYHMIGYGKLQKCRRGGDPAAWVSKPCP